MSRPTWTPAAKRDLAAIKKYISHDSKTNATRFIQRIRQAVQGATRFPEAGSLVLDYDECDVREIYVGSYRVMYRVVEGEIRVYRVIHGARLLPDSLD